MKSAYGKITYPTYEYVVGKNNVRIVRVDAPCYRIVSYWPSYVVIQVVGTFVDGPLPMWTIALYQIVTMLSYTNSAVNPVLYAFLTDNFRRTLAESFQRSSRTVTSSLVARALVVCSNALHVSVQQPIVLTPPPDRRPLNVAPGSAPNDEHSDDGDNTVMPTSVLHERGNQTSMIELHVVYHHRHDDSISDH